MSSAKPEPVATYTMSFTCSNCQHAGTALIRKGTMVRAWQRENLCAVCGCATLVCRPMRTGHLPREESK